MKMQNRFNRSSFLALCAIGALALAASCNKKSEAKKGAPKPNAPQPTAAPTTGPVTEEGFSVTGTLNLSAFSLTGDTAITHVVALNPESGNSFAVPVDPVTGKFKLPLLEGNPLKRFEQADGTLNREAIIAAYGEEKRDDVMAASEADLRKHLAEDAGSVGTDGEPTPWILTYVDANKVGKEMIVSRFSAQSLDSLAPIVGEDGALALGDVEPGSDGKATSSASYEDILGATKMSPATATTFGAMDDVCLRYVNPDIDNDGELDMPVRQSDGSQSGTQKRYILDFHNRFNWTKEDGSNIDHGMLANKFPYDVAGGLDKVRVKFTGTGITPEMEKSIFASVPTSYTWKFSAPVDVELNTCTEDATQHTRPANAPCTHAFSPDPSYGRYQFFIEASTPPEGTYTLEVGGKTFTWTDVDVADFSAGKGFLAIMSKYVVNDNGTPSDTFDDKVTGFAWKFVTRTSQGWEVASSDLIKLVVKGKGAYVSLKVDANGNQIGFTLPKVPEGTVAFSSQDVEFDFSDSVSAEIRNDFVAGEIEFSRLLNPGVSYDDKLGMRYFF